MLLLDVKDVYFKIKQIFSMPRIFNENRRTVIFVIAEFLNMVWKTDPTERKQIYC